MTWEQIILHVRALAFQATGAMFLVIFGIALGITAAKAMNNHIHQQLEREAQ